MLGTLLASLATVETAQVVGRVRSAIIGYALVGLCALTGLGFLVGAAYIAASERYGSLAAALGFAVGFLVLGGILLIYHRVSAAVRERRRSQRRSVEMKTLAGAAGVALLPLLMRRGMGLGVLLLPVAALAGLAILRENSRGDGDLDLPD